MKKIRKAIGQQLRFLKRDLGHLAWYLEQEPDCLTRLGDYELKCLPVIHTLYEQQKLMYDKRSRSVADRIVSHLLGLTTRSLAQRSSEYYQIVL